MIAIEQIIEIKI